MNELNMNLTNCYGIQNMDFSVDNICSKWNDEIIVGKNASRCT